VSLSRGNRFRLAGVLVLALVTAATVWIASSRGSSSSQANGTAASPSLRPSPKVAAAEQNQAIAEGCELSQTSTVAAPECRYLPNHGKGDVIFVGDSHSAQWLPAALVIAKSHDWGLRLWSRANCPFANVTKIIDGSPSTSCNAWRANVVDRLIADHPSLVVVSSYPPPGGQAIVDPATGKAALSSDARAIYVAGMTQELNRLAQAKIPTLLIYDQPRYSQTAPKCALAHPSDLQACSLPESVAEQSAPDAEAARHVPGLHTLDLDDVFCSADRCHQIVGSILAYRDNNHLSHEMVLSLVPNVGAAMVAAMHG
jgi:hypothetical protein